MAYTRPPYDVRAPQDIDRNAPGSWATLQRPYYPPTLSPSHAPASMEVLLALESDSSDVSDNPGDEYYVKGQSARPSALPPPPSKQSLESPDAIQGRLRELQRVEDYNIKKQDFLKAKRQRKDDKIKRKREAQDAHIKAIMDARARHDDRISRRRRDEDAAFERFDQELEEEETNLRRRLKRLKRGLPIDDMLNHGRSLSSASMSPPVSAYSSIPPPAKRHQPGPPGQMQSPTIGQPRPLSQGQSTTSSPAGSHAPAYAFLHSGHTSQGPPPGPYKQSPTYSHSQSPTVGTGNVFSQQSRPNGPPSDPSPLGINGNPSSPHISRPPQTNRIPTPTSTAPRHTASTYDTRPPPPAASSFATINAPPPSSFATINSRSMNTPPSQTASTGQNPVMVSRTTSSEFDRPAGQLHPYNKEGTPTGGNGSHANGKRTPSTTHPYQMSEAFANRHHHCERVDNLNRGIWTYYGSGGSKDNPTAPAREMYLRCNHDDCKRIDWRTVHGLQCHIVKNHEQPKGTIGSLEKALDKYGVPVSEIESYEKEHGEGTAGTMADPKNMKARTKAARESSDRAGRTSDSDSPAANTYRAFPPLNTNNTTMPAGIRLTSGGSVPVDLTKEEEKQSLTTDNTPSRPSTQPLGGFAAVNGMIGVGMPGKPTEPRDTEMQDAPTPFPALIPTTTSSVTSFPVTSQNSPRGHETTWKAWSNPVPTPPVQAPATPAAMSYMTAPPPRANTTQLNTALINTPSKVEAPSVLPQRATDQAKVVEKTKEKDVVTPVVAPPQAQAEDDQSVKSKPIEDSQMSGVETEIAQNKEQPMSAVQPAPPTDVEETQRDLPKEKIPDKPTLEIDGDEGKRPVIQSPEILNRRISIASLRRGSSRRASLAASKAAEKEKEKEKEKEREATVINAPPPPDSDPVSDVPHTDDQKQTKEVEQISEKPSDSQIQEAEDEQGDTITLMPITRSKEAKDRDGQKNKDKKVVVTAPEDDEAGKTTPKRLPNGRFLRKTTR